MMRSRTGCTHVQDHVHVHDTSILMHSRTCCVHGCIHVQDVVQSCGVKRNEPVDIFLY